MTKLDIVSLCLQLWWPSFTSSVNSNWTKVKILSHKGWALKSFHHQILSENQTLKRSKNLSQSLHVTKRARLTKNLKEKSTIWLWAKGSSMKSWVKLVPYSTSKWQKVNLNLWRSAPLRRSSNKVPNTPSERYNKSISRNKWQVTKLMIYRYISISFKKLRNKFEKQI